MKNRIQALLGSMWLIVAASIAVACTEVKTAPLPVTEKEACDDAATCDQSPANPAQDVRFRVNGEVRKAREIAVTAHRADEKWTFTIASHRGDEAIADGSESLELTVVVHANDPVGTWNVEGESLFLTEGPLPSFHVGDPAWTSAEGGSRELIMSSLRLFAFVTAYQEQFVQHHTGFIRIDSIDDDTVSGALELTVDGDVPIYGNGFDTSILTEVDGTFAAERE